MNLWRRDGNAQRADLNVRPARSADAEAVTRLAHDLSVAEGGRPARFTAERFRRDGFGPNARFNAMVAELDGEIVGYAVYYPGYDTDTATPGVYLADLYVDVAARRHGVGRGLISAVAADCRAEGGRWMFWSVLRRNRRARRFYKTMAPELKDVIVCAAYGSIFDHLAEGSTPGDSPSGSNTG